VKLAAAQSLVAWLWDQHPEIIYGLAAVAAKPQGLGALGQCFSSDLDLCFAGSTCFSSLSCSQLITDPSTTLCSVSLSATCTPLDSLGIDGGVCLPTLGESDLTQVGTCAVTGGCNIPITCGTSVGATDTATSTSLSGLSSYIASGVTALAALAKVATAYFTSQAAASNAAAQTAKTQAAIVAAQTARASTGQTALPIQYVANGTGTTTPMISTTSGLLPLTGSTLAALTPSAFEVFFAQYGTWLLVGGAAAVLAYAATRS
jgi:hypothetical protein